MLCTYLDNVKNYNQDIIFWIYEHFLSKVIENIMNGPPTKSKDLTDITNIIPPKLIRNCDYIIFLKPKETEKIEEDNLIDFDTDTDSNKTRELSPKTEEVNKKELDIIDLYENIAVTPLTLSYQNKSLNKVIFDPLLLKNTNEITEKVESNDKYADLRDLDKTFVDVGLNAASNMVLKEEVYQRDNNINELHNFYHDEHFSFPKLSFTHEADEDLIDEILSTNTLRLSMHNSDKYGLPNNNYNTTNTDASSEDKNVSKSNWNKISENNFETPKLFRTERQVSLPPYFEIKERNNLGAIPKTNEEQLKKQMSQPLNNTINKNKDVTEAPIINNVEYKITPRVVITTDISIKQYEIPKQIFEKPQSTEQIKHHINHLLKSKTKYCNVLKYYNPKDFYTTLQTKEQEFIVDTIKLDQKKYRQKRIVVEDSVAATYTIGPSWEEKKLVLPQIMDRLWNKKKRMDKFADCQPKLILDCGSLKKKDIPVKFNPDVLTDDCNRDRLRNLLMRQNFYQFVGVDEPQ